MKFNSVREALDSFIAPSLKDSELFERVQTFQMEFVNQSSESIDFFGSNLLGVHVVQFKASHPLLFFDTVLNISYSEVESTIRKIPTINHQFKKAGDVFNLTLMHLFVRTIQRLPKRATEEQKRLSRALGIIFFIRSLVTLHNAWFRYPVDPKVAQAAYAALSYKYRIKQLGSWYRYVEFRTESFMDPEKPYYARMKRYDSDLDLVRLISDATGAIREMMKEYYDKLVKVKESGGQIGVRSLKTTTIDGEETLAPVVLPLQTVLFSIQKRLSQRHGWIQEDRLKLALDVSRSTSDRLVRTTLVWIADHYLQSEHKNIDQWLTKTLTWLRNTIDQRIPLRDRTNLVHTLTQVRNLYLSTRSFDPELLRVRLTTQTLVEKANGELSELLAIATRNAVIFYLALYLLLPEPS